MQIQLVRRCNSLIAFVFLLMLWPLSTSAQSIQDWVGDNCASCRSLLDKKTGVHILERGEEALIGRAWLTQHATESIDVQYFIWSADNIGILAAEMLLTAADRGVVVRVLVDDFLMNAKGESLVILASHPNVQIKIYNPNFSVGTSFLGRMFNSVTNFRGTNQRMHDKTAIYDGVAGITGGRNMADEYFDFDHEYNFRDRDVLLLGLAVKDMRSNFDEFWESSLAVPVEELLEHTDRRMTDEEAQRKYSELHAYARDPVNFEPEIRAAIENMPVYFPTLLKAMVWHDVRFISDEPGKNSGEFGLYGGGVSTSELAQALAGAQRSVLIQSPYLVLPKGGIELLAQLSNRGVKIRISTNSLASTDNLLAFCGYFKQRPRLMNAGVEVFEFKPHPQIQSDLIRRYPRLADRNPVFAIHAKSMVIDGEQIFIGTFNLDPRSANLNTEVGVLIESETLARQLTSSIERDMRPENSWQTTAEYNPDREVSRGKRLQLGLINLFPIDPIL
jgi:putative cardiolipin synthase